MESWLLHPPRESNLQLFSLVSKWISSKIHDSQPLSVKSLKLLGDKMIKEQHFTTSDFMEAEVLLLQVLSFEIGTANIAFKFLEELFVEFEGVARVGQLVNFEASMDIMDLLYEKEETSTLYYSPRNLAASILAYPLAYVNSELLLLLCLYFRSILDLLQVATYVVTVPKQKWEFPVLPWGKTRTWEELIIPFMGLNE